MATPFQPHGAFTLQRDGNILLTTVRGPWNTELALQWAKAAQPYALGMQEIGTWGGIAIISESMLATPAAMDALKNAVSYAVTRLGCISQVVVAAPDVAGRGLVEGSFERVYQGLCLYNFFDDYASAKAWTQAQIVQYDAAKK